MEHREGSPDLPCGSPSITTASLRQDDTNSQGGGDSMGVSFLLISGASIQTIPARRTHLGVSRLFSPWWQGSLHSTTGVMAAMALLMLLAMLGSEAEAFNVDLRTAVVHKGPEGSMFGYAVAQHIDQSTNWLLIGAPKTNTSQPNLKQPGAVYRCRTDQPNDCHTIPFDDKGNNVKFEQSKKKYEIIEEKSDQWFGATVKSSGENGFIVACAPRYVYFSNDLDKREPVGVCFLSRPGTTKFERYSPCTTDNRYGFHQQGYCQAGFSATISKDGRKLLIGAPGSWYWQGQLFNYRTDNGGKLYNQTLEGKPTEDDTYMGQIYQYDAITGKKNWQTAEQSADNDYGYMGYSSAVGNFDDDGEEDYVVGIPKGESHLGKVELYNQNMTSIGSLIGDQIGSYFGSSVAVTDLNGDRLDDIIVGAPMYADYSSDAFDTGRVYIFYQTSDKKFRAQRKDILDGPDSQSRFGMAISGLRDINYDGFEDLCVGAPYAGEEKKGAIYIYHGSKRGIITDVSQVIHAKSVSPTLSAFGISISGGLDQDGNAYPDVLVGSFASDSAVFFRTRPVVRVIASLKIEPDIQDLERKSCTLLDKTKVTCFTLISCLTYDGYVVPEFLVLNSSWVFDAKDNSTGSQEQRVFLLDATTKYTKHDTYRLATKIPSCITHHAYVKNEPDDKLSPIKITLNFALVEDPNLQLHPILDAYIPVTASITTQIKKDCGVDNVCIPDLSVIVVSTSPDHNIGSPRALEILVKVTNKGEDSFNTQLWIDLPPGVAYNTISPQRFSVPISCGNFNQTLVVCDLGNPLKKDSQTSEFALYLTPTNTNETKDQLVFKFYANSSNEEKSSDYDNNNAYISIPVKVVTDLILSGRRIPEFIILNVTEPKEEVKQVKHIYELHNQGHSATNKTELQILWPSFDKNGNPVLQLDGPVKIQGNGKCDIITIVPSNATSKNHTGLSENTFDKDTDKNKKNTEAQEIMCSEKYCTYIQCTIGYMTPMESFIVTVQSQFKAKSFLQRHEDTQMYNIKSVAYAKVRSVPYDFNVDVSKFETKRFELITPVNTDRLKPASKGVELWIIALAVTAGLLMLLLLILLLWWCGFFKRKKPEDEGYFVVNGKSNIDNKIVD